MKLETNLIHAKQNSQTSCRSCYPIQHLLANLKSETFANALKEKSPNPSPAKKNPLASHKIQMRNKRIEIYEIQVTQNPSHQKKRNLSIFLLQWILETSSLLAKECLPCRASHVRNNGNDVIPEEHLQLWRIHGYSHILTATQYNTAFPILPVNQLPTWMQSWALVRRQLIMIPMISPISLTRAPLEVPEMEEQRW